MPAKHGVLDIGGLHLCAERGRPARLQRVSRHRKLTYRTMRPCMSALNLIARSFYFIGRTEAIEKTKKGAVYLLYQK